MLSSFLATNHPPPNHCRYSQGVLREPGSLRLRLCRRKGSGKREACLGSSRCRRSQSHHGRSSRLGKIHDGKASPLHSSTPYSLRKSGNYPNTFYSWQISQERIPHCPAPFQSASPYHLASSTGRWRNLSTTRRNISCP